jgi:hypothetical protein
VTVTGSREGVVPALEGDGGTARESSSRGRDNVDRAETVDSTDASSVALDSPAQTVFASDPNSLDGEGSVDPSATGRNPLPNTSIHGTILDIQKGYISCAFLISRLDPGPLDVDVRAWACEPIRHRRDTHRRNPPAFGDAVDRTQRSALVRGSRTGDEERPETGGSP